MSASIFRLLVIYFEFFINLSLFILIPLIIFGLLINKISMLDFINYYKL